MTMFILLLMGDGIPACRDGIDEMLTRCDRLFGCRIAFFIAPKVRKRRNTHGAKPSRCWNGQNRPISISDLLRFCLKPLMVWVHFSLL